MLPEFKLFPTLNKNVSNAVIITFICTFLIWYANYHWSRRKLYQAAWKRKGPIALPFIGSIWYFSGSTNNVLDKIVSVVTNFETPVPVWIGQKLFFGITSPKDMEIVMNKALTKGDAYNVLTPIVGHGLFTAPVPTWKPHRKVILPTFKQKILDGYMEIFSKKSDILVEKLKTHVGKGIIDINDYMSLCSLDVICETTLGIKINAQSTKSNYMDWTQKVLGVAISRTFSIFWRKDFIFNRTSMAKEFYEVIKNMHDLSRAFVKEKQDAHQEKLKENKEQLEADFEEGSLKKTSFLQELIELPAEKANFTDKELRDEVDSILIAGTETTSTTVSFALVMLGMNPDMQKRVYEEVMEVCGSDKPVECKDLGKLVYTERVLKETLRIFPAGPVIVRTATEDIKLEKCTVPAGSGVALCIIALHRDPEVWPNPLKFDPDRFLPEEGNKRHPYSWVPFSAGPRNCIGIKYAMMAVKVLLATVIRKYKFSTEYKSIEEIKLTFDSVLRPVHGYPVTLELRE